MDNIKLEDISSGVLYKQKLNSTYVSADNVLNKFNNIIDELNETEYIDEIYSAEDDKYPLDCDITTSELGEFHSICSSEDGKTVIFGSDEDGDSPWTLLYSSDGMKSVRRAIVEPSKNVISNYASEFVNATTELNKKQFRAITYNSKHHIFIATKLNTAYKDSDNIIWYADCIWVSHTGKRWKCICLEKRNTTQTTDIAGIAHHTIGVTKIAYDADKDIVLVPGYNKIFYSSDCINWKSFDIPGSSDIGDYDLTWRIGSIDVISSGKYLAWNTGNYVKNYGVFELEYNSDNDSFSCSDIIKAIDTTELYEELKTRFSNNGSNVDTAVSYDFCVTEVNGSKAYYGFLFHYMGGLIGILEYDISLKKFTAALNSGFKTNNDVVRGSFVYNNNVYFIGRNFANTSVPYIIKIDSEGTSSVIDINCSNKLENGCVINNQTYLVGRKGGNGLIFNFDSTYVPADDSDKNTPTKILFNSQHVIKSDFDKIDLFDSTKLDSYELSEVVTKLNEILTVLKS